MKRFFKPKGKDDKLIPYPLDLPSSSASSVEDHALQSSPYDHPPQQSSQPRRTDGPIAGPKPNAAGTTASDLGGSHTSLGGHPGRQDHQSRANHDRHHLGVLRWPNNGSRDALPAQSGGHDLNPSGDQDDANANRVRRRTSLKTEGKLFAWGRDKAREKDKDRENGHSDSPHSDEQQWTIIPPGSATSRSAPVATIPEAKDSPPQTMYYLPPGAQPADPLSQVIPQSRPYPVDSVPKPRLPSGGRDYLSGRATAPLQPSRTPTLEVDPRSQSPYGYPNPRPTPPPQAVSSPLPMPTPMPLLSPPPVIGRQAGSDGWSPASSEHESLPKTHSRGYEGGGPQAGYHHIIPAMESMHSSEDDLPTPVYARQMPESQRSDPIPFLQPRPAPRIPAPRPSDSKVLPNTPEDQGSGVDVQNPAVTLSAASSPGPVDVVPGAGYALSKSVSPGNGGYGGADDKKKDKGRLFGLGGLRSKDKDRYKASDSRFHESLESHSTDLHVARSTGPSIDGGPRDLPSSYGGGVIQPVTFVEPLSKREREKIEKAERDRQKEAHKREKEFLKELEKKEKEAEAEDTVGRAIAQICHRSRAADVAEIISLCERVAHSPESVSKDAARAVRKELKYGSSETAKITAAKIWLLGCANSAEKGGFRTYGTDKKFMSAVQEILTAPPDREPLQPDTRERIRDTLAHLNHVYGGLKGGEHLRACWMKVKTPDEPEEGYPLATTHPVYSAQDRLLNTAPTLPDRKPSPRNPLAPPHRMRQVSSYSGLIPDEDEEAQRLIREAVTAKEHARVLQQALAFTTPAQLEEKDVIKEFYASCIKDQESLISQMGWANAQAEKSRIRRGVPTPSVDAVLQMEDMDKLSLNDTETPLAEKAFAELLEANAELSEVLRLHEEMERMARNDQELRMVQERSKVDTRMDRSKYHSDGLVPPPVVGEGSSRSPSPKPSALPEDNHSVATHSTSGPKPSYLHENRRSREALTLESMGYQEGQAISRATTPDSQREAQPPKFPSQPRTASPTRLGHKIQGPRPLAESLKRGLNGSASSLRNVQPLTRPASLPGSTSDKKFVTGYLIDSRPDIDLDDAAIQPFKPSTKALGKRPQLMTNGSFDPDDIWKTNDTPAAPADESSSSEDDYWNAKPVRSEVYAYDAYRDRGSHAQPIAQSKPQGHIISSNVSSVVGGSKTPSVADTGNAVMPDGETVDNSPEDTTRPSLDMGDARLPKSGGRWKPWKQAQHSQH